MNAFKKYCCFLFLGFSLSFSALSHADEETVTIRNEGDKTFYEYKLNGEIVEIKVVPKNGKPYYLVPGNNEHDNFVRREQSRLHAPSWILFRW